MKRSFFHIKNTLAIAIFSSLFVISCKKESPEDPIQNPAGFSNGTFVINEGAFGSNNASISFISFSGDLTSDPYFDVNGTPIGDVLQSFTIVDNKGYAVLNNSQRIDVLDMITFEHKALIEGFTYPRYFLPVGSEKAYVSDGNLDGTVQIVNLSTNTITGSIAVGKGPETMMKYGNHVFVCNSGGWATDNTISVIDVLTDQVVQTLVVGDRPVDMCIDYLSNIWVICSGETLYDVDWNVIGHTDASIVRIDALGLNVIDAFTIGINGDHPRLIESTATQFAILYENHGVYAINVASPSFPGVLLIGGNHNGLGVNPWNGEIWTAGPADFISASHVRKHDSFGVELGEFTAGIGANGFAFN